MEEKIIENPMPEKTDKTSADHKNSRLYEEIRDSFGLKALDAGMYSPLALAYMGDCVYELLIRTCVVSEANMQVNKLNKRGSELAMAKTQALVVELLEKELTEEERRIVQRGKNAKVVNIPKSCTPHEYHLATGFESLIGFLYLNGQSDRLMELVARGWQLLAETDRI